ncbi:MAG TPA: MFS transporter, partial [Ramlibacter sp.]|nr:MFS transporter [Ramlibacter sp.]
VGHGLEAPPSSQLLSHHVPQARRALVFSFKQTGVQIGAVLASLGLPLAAAWLGWRGALAAVAVGLVLLAACLASPALRHPMPDSKDRTVPLRLSAALRGLLSWTQALREDRGLLRLALSAAAFGSTQMCMNTFMVTWMVVVRGAPLATAGVLAATAQGAGMVGRPLWGWVASRSGGSRPVLVGLGALMAACSLALGLAGPDLPMWLLLVLAAFFGLSASGWNGVFLAEVAARRDNAQVAPATAAAMVPLLAGLIVAPVVFAAVGRAIDLSAGFVLMAVVALGGAVLAAGRR